MDYRKMYAHLVGVIDNALDLLEEGDLVKAAPIRELLQNALLEAEEAYIREPEDISLSESHTKRFSLQQQNKPKKDVPRSGAGDFGLVPKVTKGPPKPEVSDFLSANLAAKEIAFKH